MPSVTKETETETTMKVDINGDTHANSTKLGVSWMTASSGIVEIWPCRAAYSNVVLRPRLLLVASCWEVDDIETMREWIVVVVVVVVVMSVKHQRKR